jgi:hypothetical protein
MAARNQMLLSFISMEHQAGVETFLMAAQIMWDK